MPNLALTLAVARTAIRSPTLWLISALTALLAWAAATLDVVAVGGGGAGVLDLGLTTAEMGACLGALFCLSGASGLGSDRGGLTAELGCLRIGPTGLSLSRILGSALAAQAPWIVTTATVVVVYTHNSSQSYISMYYTISWMWLAVTLEIACAAAWFDLLAVWSGETGALLSTLGLLVASRLSIPPALRALLPVPAIEFRSASGVLPMASAALATLGLFLISNSIRRRRVTA